jgi:tRNA(Ile)-lysidine synthase
LEENVLNDVLNTIKKYNLINPKDKVVVGVSGGPDSICLLHVLNILKDKIGFEIVVAHINHMIRKEADEETKYVEDMCKTMNIKCFVKRIDVIKLAKEDKVGTEEEGRKIRYEFFEEVLNLTGSNKIATAHNANDNAETVLMNIFRGTGVSGLKGIRPIRDNKFIRPLIECERVYIEEYCDKWKLNPKIDKSNFDNVYTRNKIRNIIIPELKEMFNPNIVTAINKLSDISAKEEQFIEKYIQELIKEKLYINPDQKVLNDLKIENSSKYKIIDLKEFNKLDDFIKSRVIIEITGHVVGSIQGIEKVNIEEIIKLCSRNIGNKYLTPNKFLKVYVNKNKAVFMKVS